MSFSTPNTHTDENIIRKFDTSKVTTPCFVVFEKLLEHNLKILQHVREQTGCKILLALKCFSMKSTFPLLSEFLDGTCASGPYEARLGREYFGKEVHVFSPAFSQTGIEQCSRPANHIVFNSLNQFNQLHKKAGELNPDLSFGLRVNPEHSETANPLYDPCAAGSRLGITLSELGGDLPAQISGLHFHTLCEMGADALERTLEVFEKKFGKFFGNLSWVNFGGGHHITRENYEVESLIHIIQKFRTRYPHLAVYLEPGEAVALTSGILEASILDVKTNGATKNVILDTSAACHMPDVLEVPYQPIVLGSGAPNEKKYTYQLGGVSCLAGDVMGKYSFDKPLSIGDRVTFMDMAIYTMVKTNTFNGLKLPDIYYARKNGTIERERKFGFEDFKMRI